MNIENLNDSPIISVCLITYNHEKYVAQAIDSVLMQRTLFPFELVIGEDYSTDKTRDTIKDYALKHPNIRLLLPAHNLGMMQNFINTLDECRGKYIAILEGDDYWFDPNKLQVQVDYLENNPQCSLLFTKRKILNGERIKDDNSKYKPVYSETDVLKGFIPNTQTIMLKNDKTLPVFLSQFQTHPSADRLIGYWATQKGEIHYMDKYSAVYRITGSGAWSSYNAYNQFTRSVRILDEFYSLLNIKKGKEYREAIFEKQLQFLLAKNQSYQKVKVIFSSIRFLKTSYLSLFIKRILKKITSQQLI